MRWADFIVTKYRKLTNMAGAILLAWILSAVAAHAIGFFLPSGLPALSNSTANRLDSNRSILSSLDQKTLAHYMPICERDIFDSLKRSSCLAEDLPIIDDTPEYDPKADPVKSDLQAKLLGTMVSTNRDFSFATISPRSGKESHNYYIGDTLMSEAKIYEIERNRAYFIRNGRKEYIEVDKLPAIYDRTPSIASTPTPRTSGEIKRMGDKIVVSRGKVESTLSDLNKVIQQSRMVPNFVGGQVNGFKIFAIRPGSIFQQLGLKNGDVIERINGTQINSVEKALPMLQLLKTESNITIDMTRRGTKKSLNIEIQ